MNHCTLHPTLTRTLTQALTRALTSRLPHPSFALLPGFHYWYLHHDFEPYPQCQALNAIVLGSAQARVLMEGKFMHALALHLHEAKTLLYRPPHTGRTNRFA